MDYGELKERLREKATGKRNKVGDYWGDWVIIEGIQAITALEARVAELEGALREIATNPGGGGKWASIIARTALENTDGQG